MTQKKPAPKLVDFSMLPKICEIRKSEFNKLWERLVGNGHTHQAAYKALEAEHVQAFGCRRFKNYQSFRKSRAYRIRHARPSPAPR